MKINDICGQISDLIGDLSGMEAQLNAESEAAAYRAAKIIQGEQRRIFAKASFKRDKASHKYKFASSGNISITERKIGKYRVKMQVGFDTETLREYPELLMIEFGRPGKSPRHSKSTDKLKRKKGDFPEAATVMPIRTGFELAKEQALKAYSEDMLDKAENLWKNRANT